MFPTLFLLAGSMVAPAPLSVPPAGQQLPDANGPNAIFRKYKFEPIPMGGWGGMKVLEDADYNSQLEQLRKQIEERRRPQK